MEELTEASRNAGGGRLNTRASLLVAIVGIVLSWGVAKGQVVSEPARGEVGELGISWTGSVPGQPVGERDWVVRTVVPCSHAHQIGIRPGDVLLDVDGRVPGGGPPFPRAAVGSEYSILVGRGGHTLRVELVVGPSRRDRPQAVSDPRDLPSYAESCALPR